MTGDEVKELSMKYVLQYWSKQENTNQNQIEKAEGI